MKKKPTYEELEQRINELEEMLNLDSPAEDSTHYRKILDCSSAVIYSKDLEGRYISVNKQFENLSGYKMKDIILKTDFELFPESVAVNSTENDRRVIQTGAPLEIEEFGPVDGQMHTFMSTKYPLVDENGDVYGICGISTDITDRKQALREHSKVNALLDAASHMAKVGAWEWDIEKDIWTFSDSWLNIHGCSDRHLKTADLLSIAHPDDRADIGLAFDKAVADGVTYEIEHRIIRQDTGEELIIRAFGRPKMDTNGKVVRLFGATQDITVQKRTEASLIKNESLFRGLYDNMTSGSAIYEVINDGSKGSDYIVKNFNKKSLEIEGKRLDQVVGKSLFDLRPNIDEYGLIPAMKRVWDTGKPGYFPVKIYQDDIFSSFYENQIFRLTTGEIVTIYDDVTDIKNAEKTIKKQNTNLKLAQRIASIGTWILDPKIGVPEWSDEVFRIYERDPKLGPLAIADYKTIYRGKYWEIFNSAIQGAIKDGIPYDIELKLELPSGHIKWVHAMCEPEPEAGAHRRKLRGTIQDITDRKNTENALRTSHNRFLTVLDSIDAIVYVVDMGTYEILFMNKYMINVFGKDMIGEPCWDVLRGEQGPCNYCNIPSLVDMDGNPTGVKIWHDKNPLTGRYYINHDRAIEWTDGRLVKLQIATDITDYKLLEKKLLQAQKMESIGTLAGGIAHDFNNILSSILGFSDLALSGVDKGSELEDDIQEIRTAGMRAKDLVKQILTFARQSDDAVKPIQVSTIVKEVLKFLKSSIPTTIQITDNLNSDSFIMGSPTQLHQVFMNLCTNAAQAMEENGGRLEVTLDDITIDKMTIPDLKAGEYIEIKVTDTGRGISPHHIHTIFEPYFTTKPVGEGTGMGLAVVHGIIESYGGKITVKSSIGKGCSFFIYLPISKKRRALAHPEPEKLPSGDENILFVDDEYPIAKIGSKILGQLGYSVTTRTSSIEALELFRMKPQSFDLVITDMTMPNMTGDKMAEEIMKIRSDIPVILCTGYSKKISEESAEEIGIKAFAYKPIVNSELAKTVRKVLDDSKCA